MAIKMGKWWTFSSELSFNSKIVHIQKASSIFFLLILEMRADFYMLRDKNLNVKIKEWEITGHKPKSETHTVRHKYMFSSIQLLSLVVSDTLRTHGLQQARPPCPSPTPRVYSNSCWLSQWYATISSFVFPVSSRLKSFQASGSFSMS